MAAMDNGSGGDRGANVIALAQYRAGQGNGAGDPLLDLVSGHWQDLRRGRDLPRRADLDPRAIEAALVHALIAERIAPGQVRLRLAGRHLCDLLGMEVRGMPLGAFFTAAARPALQAMLEQVFDSPARLTLGLAAERGMGRPALSGRLILLPLRDDLGRISRALGCLVTSGRIGRLPRRFDIAGSIVTPIRAGTDAPAAGRPDPRRLAAFREPPAGYRARPALHLVDAATGGEPD